MAANLSACELASMRKDVAGLLPDICNILAPAYVSDGQGGETLTWGTVASNVACRLDVKTKTELTTAGAKQAYNVNYLTLLYDQVISSLNRVEISGNPYYVTALEPADKSWSICKRVQIDEVING